MSLQITPGDKYPKSEILEILSHFKELQTEFETLAQKVQQEHFGNGVYIRGLIEVSSFCRCNCLYCGIRKGNFEAQRYRLTDESILERCKCGYENGFRTFVLQGGEDLSFSELRVANLIEKIKTLFPDCAITLSLGERSYKTYKLWWETGADRYLLRHEAASPELFAKLHPQNQKLENRCNCLSALKELGYQVGSGFMVGSPFQTLENLAEDILFLQELNPQMIGIGPFIPHNKTPFANHPAGSTELTLFLISLLRLLFPSALIPATTALNTLSKTGRTDGINAGANVIMPNLTPKSERKKYDLYEGKTAEGDGDIIYNDGDIIHGNKDRVGNDGNSIANIETLENLRALENEINKIGYKILLNERGDFKIN